MLLADVFLYILHNLKEFFIWSINMLFSILLIGKTWFYDEPIKWIVSKWRGRGERLSSTAKIAALYHNQVMEIRQRKARLQVSPEPEPKPLNIERLLSAATSSDIIKIKRKLKEYSELPPWGRSGYYTAVHSAFYCALDLAKKSHSRENVTAFKQQYALAQGLEERFKESGNTMRAYMMGVMQTCYVRLWDGCVRIKKSVGSGGRGLASRILKGKRADGAGGVPNLE